MARGDCVFGIGEPSPKRGGPRRIPAWWPWPLAGVLIVVLFVTILGRCGTGAEEGGESRAEEPVERRWPAASYPASRDDRTLEALRDSLGPRLRRIVNSHPGRMGVWVGGPAPDEEIWAHRADEAFVPASNAKLFSTGAAWLAYGEDHVLATRVVTSGSVEFGVLSGDLIVVGGGPIRSSDPEIDGVPATYPATELARAIADAGITRIAGRLLLDDGLFDRERVHPDWGGDPVTYHYRPQVTALYLNDACVKLTVMPGAAAGAPAVLAWEPTCDVVSVKSRVRTAKKGTPKPSIDPRRAEGTNDIVVRGRVNVGSAGQSGLCTVHHPTLVFGSVLGRALDRAGIALEGSIEVRRGAGAVDGLREIARVETPLRAAVMNANTHSHNLTAECLLRLAGARVEGEGSWEAGSRAVESALREAGIATDGLVVADGSGLSGRNRCTPRQVGSWLRYLLAAPGGAALRETLATGGTPGTLRSRLRELKGRVRLKTGYVSYRDGGRRRRARALSGYVETEGAGTLVVAILTVDVPKEFLDRIVVAVAGAR